jgi:hypothetical protein
MDIRYVKNSGIDRMAWDKCITVSYNGNNCVYSWFLDLICEDWDALVEGNYDTVMPLAIKRFLGKEIIYLPYFAFDFGIFSYSPVTPDKTFAFIQAVPDHFRYLRIMLNKFNPVDTRVKDPKPKVRYELDLIKAYHRLSSDYSPDLKRRLNMATGNGYSFSGGLSPNELIRFIAEKKIRLPNEITRNHFRLLRSVMAGLIRYKSGELCGVYDHHNELSSVALIDWFGTRINLVFQVIAPEKFQDAPHLFLIDRIINKYAETNTTLLFESVNTPTLPVTYQDFGANKSHWLEVLRNKLPFPQKWLINYLTFRTFFSSVHSLRS